MTDFQYVSKMQFNMYCPSDVELCGLVNYFVHNKWAQLANSKQAYVTGTWKCLC